jgi:uncharacterized protein (TIGR00255 family)
MSLESMTGFGEARALSQGWRMRVTCRSVNHRGLSVRASVPQGWFWLESLVQRAVSEHFERGRIDVRVEVERDLSDDSVTPALVDEDAFAAICARLRQLQYDHDLGQGLSLSDVMHFEEHFSVEGTTEVEDDLEDRDPFVEALVDALDALEESRRAEGRELAAEMERLLDELGDAIDRAAEMRPARLEAWRERAAERVRESVEQFLVDEIEPSRLLQELALMAERSDIAEEFARARAHIDTLRDLLAEDADDAPRGKKIDFYLQELVRETNTMGSKSFDEQMTDAIVSAKTLVSEMREQAANIE